MQISTLCFFSIIGKAQGIDDNYFVSQTDNVYNVHKFLFDKFIAILLLTLFSPLFFIIPLIIRIDSKGPSFYSQKRVGKNYEEFNLLKYDYRIERKISNFLWNSFIFKNGL